MKGARRTRRPRQEAGFADLMAPPHPSTNMRGVVTGLSHAQSAASTPKSTTPKPTTPPPPDEDWGALLQISPKRRMSPQKPIITSSRASSSSNPLSPTTPSRNPFVTTSPQSNTSNPPTRTPPPPISHPQPSNTTSPSTSTPVPAFLSGWDGAEGWGDDPSLDDSDPDIDEEVWGVWPEGDQLSPPNLQSTTVTPPPAAPDQSNSAQESQNVSNSDKVEQTIDPTLDLGVSAVADPSAEHSDNLDTPKQQSPRLLPDDDSAASPKTPPAHTLQNSPVPKETQVTLQVSHHAFWDRTGDTGAFGGAAATDSTTMTPGQDLRDPTGAVKGQQRSHTIDTVPAEDALPTAMKGVAVETTDFSGWNDEEIPQDDLAEFPTPDTHSTQIRQESPIEENKLRSEIRDDERLVHDDAPEQAGNLMQTETVREGVIVPAEDVLPTATKSAAEQQLYDPSHTDRFQDGHQPDSRLETTDFSGWDDVEIPQDDLAEFPTPDTHSTQIRQESPAEETKPRSEIRDDERLVHDDVREQAGSLVQTETVGEGVVRANIPTIFHEIHDGPNLVTKETVAAVDQPQDAPHAPLNLDAWDFDEASTEVPVVDAGWEWGTADDVPKVSDSAIEDTERSKIAHRPVLAKEVTFEASRRYSQNMTAAGERGDQRQVKTKAVPALTAPLESRPDDSGGETFLALEPSTAACDGWGLDKDPGESNGDDWAWGVQAEPKEVESIVDMVGGKSETHATASTPPPQFPSVQSHTFEPFPQSSEQTWQQTNTADEPKESADYTRDLRSPKLEARAQYASHEPLNSPGLGISAAVGTEESCYRPYDIRAEGGNSFPPVEETGQQESPRGDRTLTGVISDVKDHEGHHKAGLRHNGSFRNVEDEACGSDIRSTDADVSSTLAGTDVPSVAAPSSVDDAEWELDQNELVLNASSASAVGQNPEKESSTAHNVTSVLWSENDNTTQTDRSWANPDAMWSSPDEHPQALIAAEGETGQPVMLRKEPPTENESLSCSPQFPKVSSRAQDASDPCKFGVYSGMFPTDNSLPENTSAYPQIGVTKFQHYHEDRAAGLSTTGHFSSDQTKTQMAERPGAAAENKSNSEQHETSQARRQDRVESSPESKSISVPNNTAFSYSAPAQGSNVYWTERLDQSRSQRPESSNDKLPLPSTGVVKMNSEVGVTRTPLASPEELQKTGSNIEENENGHVPAIREVRTLPSENAKPPFTCVSDISCFVPGLSDSLESHPAHERAPQQGPGPESVPDLNRTGNVVMNSTSSWVDAKPGPGGWGGNSNTAIGVSNESELKLNSQTTLVATTREWPTETFADGDGSNYFDISNEGEDVHNKRIVKSQASHNHESFFEQPKTEAFNLGPSEAEALKLSNSSSADWNRYAPRISPRSFQQSSPEAATRVSSPPATHISKDLKQEIVRTTATSFHETGTYDPFALSHEDATICQTQGAYEAFDWSVGMQESSNHAEIPPPASSPITQPNLDKLVPGSAKQVPDDAVVEQVPVQANTSQNRVIVASTPNASQETQVWNEAVLGLQENSADRNIQSLEQRAGSLKTHTQGVEQGYNEYQTGRSPNANSPEDPMTFSTSGAQTSLGEGISMEQYAPRITRTMKSEGRYATTGSLSWTDQARFEASNTHESDANFRNRATSTELGLPDAPVHGSDFASYQPITTQASSPYEGGVLYAPAESAAPIEIDHYSKDSKSHQTDTEVFAPSIYNNSVLRPQQAHVDEVSVARPPLPPAPSNARVNSAQYSGIPSTSGPIAGMSSQDHTGCQEDQAIYGANPLPFVPVQSEGLQQAPYEGSVETTAIKHNSTSMYGGEGKPVSTLDARQTIPSSPYSPLAAYGNVAVPFPSQKEIPTDAAAPKEVYVEKQVPRNVSREGILGFNGPPLAQPAPPEPPSILSHQDLFQAESIVDPATFLYPYSIMDTEASGDLSQRPPRAVISWGFGGQLVSIMPSANHAAKDGPASNGGSVESTGSSPVHIHDMSAITQDGNNDDWAAVSEAVAPLAFPLRPSDLSVYADMCDRLAKLSGGLSGSESEGRAAMWRMLALLCRHGTSDWRSNASAAICGPSSVPMFGRNDSSSLLTGKPHCESSPLRQSGIGLRKSELEESEAAAEVERLLTEGNATEAIRVAKEAGLWSLALVLAATVDKSYYMKAVSEFARTSLNDGSALQTLCLSMAEDDSEILRKATSPSGLKEWRKTVGMLLTARRSTVNTGDGQDARFLRLIDQIGEALITQMNDTVAGHVCFLLSGRLWSLDSSHIPLLGADAKLPAGRPRSMGSPAVVLQSLVFEAIANSQNGATYPHLLPFRLLLAEELCSAGRVDVAFAHCESISSAVREIFECGGPDFPCKHFTPPFLSRLESLEHYLRGHLGLQESGEKKGALSALGKSLSSVFTKPSTSNSRSTERVTPTSAVQVVPSVGSQGALQPQPVPFPSASPPPPSMSPVNPLQHAAQSPWTPNFEPSQLQPLPVAQSSQSMRPESQSGDTSGNERWNSLVSKTIGFIAPAEGDLSPPLKARGDQGFPLHSQPTPLGLGSGTGTRAPGHDSHDSHLGHMRSASVGDVPMTQSQTRMLPGLGQGSYPHHSGHGLQDPMGHPYHAHAQPADQTVFNGMPVQKTTTAESGATGTHRRSASDVTFESQTSEKKPPRLPKKSSATPKGLDAQLKKEKVPVVRGWRSRLSEKIRAAFSGPPRAHMGVENKFRFDKERGRWIMEGEDPDEDEDTPPPPPEDDTMVGAPRNVPYNQSYESLPNPDLRTPSMPYSQVGHSQGGEGFFGGATGEDTSRRYSSHAQLGYNSSMENVNSRDTGSESSVASAASAPVPYSSQAGIPMPVNPGNKFRAHSGRLSGRRAYVDTFNKGTPAASMSAGVPTLARPGMPGMPGLGSSGGSGYRIFTPSPAISAERQSTNGSSGIQGEVTPLASSIVESNDQVHPEKRTPNGQQQGTPFGYALSDPAPMPSVAQYQRNARKEHQPRLMA